MTHNPWGNYRTAPLAVKLLGWLSIPIVLFFMAHTIIQIVYADEIIFENWVGELYHFIWLALPVFLYLTGYTIADKKLRITTNTLLVLYGVCAFLNFGNVQEWVDVPHLMYPSSIAILGVLATWVVSLRKSGSLLFSGSIRLLFRIFLALYVASMVIMVLEGYGAIDLPLFPYWFHIPIVAMLITWLVHLIQTRKNTLDLVKFIWFYGVCYSFVVHFFVPHKHEAGNYYFASIFIFPVMMIIGLYKFFANKNHSHEQT